MYPPFLSVKSGTAWITVNSSCDTTQAAKYCMVMLYLTPNSHLQFVSLTHFALVTDILSNFWKNILYFPTGLISGIASPKWAVILKQASTRQHSPARTFRVVFLIFQHQAINQGISYLFLLKSVQNEWMLMEYWGFSSDGVRSSLWPPFL